MLKLVLALLLSLSWIGPIRGQQQSEAEDLSMLRMDALIERLPAEREDWLRDEDGWRLLPAASEMKARLERGAALTGEQWSRALRRTGALRHKSRWPQDRPFALSMRAPGWLPVTQIRMVPRQPGWESAQLGLLYQSTCGTFMGWKDQEWRYQELGSLPVGVHPVVFDVTIERGHRSGLFRPPDEVVPASGVLWSGEMALHVEVFGTIDEAVPPVSSPACAAAVRRSLSLAFSDWAGGRKAILVADPDVRGDAVLRNLGLSLAIDVLEGHAVVESLTLVPSTQDSLAGSNSVHGTAEQPIAFTSVESIPVRTESDAHARLPWSIRVRGTSEHVWALWEAEQRWAGELVIPLDELIEREHELAPDGRGPWIWSPRPR